MSFFDTLSFSFMCRPIATQLLVSDISSSEKDLKLLGMPYGLLCAPALVSSISAA